MVYTASTAGAYYEPAVTAHGGMERGGMERGLHQHSIESSVVTEGHYDASFETEDFPTGDSFDVAPPAAYPGQHGQGIVNGHFKGATNGAGKAAVGGGGRAAASSPAANGVARVVGTVQPTSLTIQSIPSEVELVREGGGDVGGKVGEMTIQPNPGGMMLWKRVRHCVVFGGTVVKKKEKK